MKRHLAYITAPWSLYEDEIIDDGTDYCRAAYEAGFNPICPQLSLGCFLDDWLPQEHKDYADMSQELLRRCSVLIVCGEESDDTVKNDIALAKHLGITTTTLEGIQTVRDYCRGAYTEVERR